MAQPVWVLSVDLQTKTATFQTGLADAAKAARGSFNDIKGGAGEMGGRVGTSMTEARHSVVLLGEEFGIHLPRAVSTFLAGLGPVGAAMEAAFPFLVIAYGAGQLIQHLEKLHEAGEKLTGDQAKLGITVQNVFNALDSKIIQAQIRTDELRNNHLGALKLQLELINKQSLEELVHSFEEVAKASDVVMKDLEGHWYAFGIGSDGAKHALTQFQTQYDSLLSQGKDKDATDLLAGTRLSAQHILDMMHQYKSAQYSSTGGDNSHADYNKFEEAALDLKKAGVGVTEKEVQAQESLVGALTAQVAVEQRVHELKKIQGGNIKIADSKADSGKADEEARKRAEGEDKAERGYAENFKRYEEQKIAATESGSVARMAALTAAMTDARLLYGADSDIFIHYQDEKSKAFLEMTGKQLEAAARDFDEQQKLQADAARETADNAEKMGELAVAAEKEHNALVNSGHRANIQQRAAQESAAATEAYNIKMAALQRDETGLDKYGKDYQNQLKQIQDKETQLTRAHENELTAIKDKAEQERNASILSAENKLRESIAHGLTESIMGHQTWARMVQSLGDQVVSGMLENAIKSVLADDFTKEKDAAAAARKAYIIGLSMGGPAGVVLGPVLGAAAFASVMAFEGGTDRVPGVGRGDTVPALLSPGEGVVPGGVMDGLRNMARSGGLESGSHIHLHGVSYAPSVQALDADGVDKVLDKHADKFQRHFENALRRTNR